MHRSKKEALENVLSEERNSRSARLAASASASYAMSDRLT